MTQQQNAQKNTHPNQPPPPPVNYENTQWAYDNVAGSYADIATARAKLREAATNGCRVIGGMSNMPIPVGHELCISVVAIDETALFPINATAKAFAKGGAKAMEAMKPEEREMPRWGLGKSIIMSLATAIGVEWTGRKRLDDGSEPYYCEVQVWGRYKQADGTYRPISQTCDMDYRDGSPQIAGKTEAQIIQLRGTIKRKAETGAKLRALREAFGIDHGINDDQIDRPFVISRVAFTGRTDDPELKTLFGLTIAQQHLAASGALFGQITPSIPLFGAGSNTQAPQIGMGSPAAPGGQMDFDDDPDLAEGSRAAGAAPRADETAAPAKLPPPPPKPPPAPGKPDKVYIGGKDGGPIAKATDKDLGYWEKRNRQEFDEGFDPRYAEKNTIKLLTIRAEMRSRGLEVEPHEALDAMDPKMRSAAPARHEPASGAPQGEPRPEASSTGRARSLGAPPRPPSDRGSPARPPSDKEVAAAAFGRDEDDGDGEYR